MDAQKVGSFIRDQRKKKHLNQKQLAEFLYVSPTAVSKWESGANLPEITNLKAMAEIFEVSIEEMLNGEKSPETFEVPVLEPSEPDPLAHEPEPPEPEPTISPPQKKAIHKTRAVLLITSLFIVGTAAIVGFYFYITAPRFRIVDSYYGASPDILHIENAFCIVVEYDGRVTRNDVMKYSEMIREEYQDYFEEVDEISIVYYDKYDAAAPSLTADYYAILLPLPDFFGIY